ncbi:hypothetical protein P872_14240 [Rhodonellum psychrophilum GCM71 = DSM 17998]|uniref:6-bladed beta-propeller n=2 Tax=Rhodonellum TaxID=336827 RepID=U5BWA3_9BACT|nr:MULTISPECIES: 6-bladed beta-propeller [Rhodonellum]ERM80222.1 hypothetical protein P872_14240 [Rhodonellum psychrophilum GCM71 = DSM 17998]SDZ39138.1 6-bladed beta-propeller protein [Rhodonellum ikkaensis]
MKLLKYTLYSFLLVFFSCNTTPKNNKIVIDVDKSISGNFSDVFGAIEYVLIKEDSLHPMVNPYKFEFVGDRIFILDDRQNKFFSYSAEGKFLYAISASGAGPLEFETIDDFQILGQRIFLKDAMTKKTLIFDLDGNVLGTENNELLKASFYRNDDFSLYYMHNDPEMGFRIIKKKNDEVTGYIDIPKNIEKRISLDQNGFIQRQRKGLIYYNLPFSQSIAVFDKDGDLEYVKNFDFGKYGFDSTMRSRFSGMMEENEYIQANGLIDVINSFLPLKDSYLMVVRQNSNAHYIFLDSKNKVRYQGKNMNNDIDRMQTTSIPWTINGDQVVVKMYSNQFKSNYMETFGNESKTDQGDSNIHSFYEEHKEELEDEHLILMYLTVKDFK